jgi:hypothetical protein
VKDVELLDPKAHKDIRDFAAFLTRNARHRLAASVAGTGPKLVVALTLDSRGLRTIGGLITTRWEGVLTLDAAFRTETGASVARVAAAAEVRDDRLHGGHLQPAGDRLIDDLVDFLASCETDGLFRN